MPKTKIEKLREAKGWERVDLASKASVSERTIYNIETAKRRGVAQRPMFQRTQERIARALGVSVAAIFKNKVAR